MELAAMSNVVFGYSDFPCLEDVHLSIAQGEFVAIVGPNGAAKTTLLKLMLGLLKPWSGEVMYPVAAKQGDGTKTRVGYVPQQMAAFNSGFPSKVMEFVRSGRFVRKRWYSRWNVEDRQVVEQVLKQVGMWSFWDSRIGELSGGQKQRICIARALVQEPDLLVLDEPTTGMDKESRLAFYELMDEQVKMHKRTVVIVTHNLEEVLPKIDRVIELKRKEGGDWKCCTTNSCSGHFWPGA
ncbi:metal ABC transporter ATP-binding protein [Paenibacillus sp. H1-7]|uniref:metal ABC transporter ATP-binding protein n=1 Tax=Paenibacillus sp. H1-7 TaxID=2282849 RepID=UPI001EF8CE1B|nr:metal ABC transporter ATP-binding protein [Paenibacillus sp. H1-7]ULL18140.1 metal ABC transporter ATP-binding protein [Paenibacillus sp. H1-7]